MPVRANPYGSSSDLAGLEVTVAVLPEHRVADHCRMIDGVRPHAIGGGAEPRCGKTEAHPPNLLSRDRSVRRRRIQDAVDLDAVAAPAKPQPVGVAEEALSAGRISIPPQPRSTSIAARDEAQ
jgi:hypothetical protein